jgi:hypothetical protein
LEIEGSQIDESAYSIRYSQDLIVLEIEALEIVEVPNEFRYGRNLIVLEVEGLQLLASEDFLGDFCEQKTG